MRTVKFLSIISSNVLPMLFWIFLMFGLDSPIVVLYSVLCALVHEAGHLISARLLRIKTETPRATLDGFRIKTKSTYTYTEEIIILLSGPLMNVVLSLLLTLLFPRGGSFALLSSVSLATGISNLIPIEGNDGYGILRATLSGKEVGDSVLLLDRVSFTVCVVMTFFSLYLLDKSNSGYWLFSIFFISLVKNINRSLSQSIF